MKPHKPGRNLMKSFFHRLAVLAAALLLSGAAHAHACRAQAARAGGASLMLEVKAEATQLKRAVERTAEVMRKRCRLLGVKCELRPGDAANRLALSFPASADAARVRGVLLARGMEVRAVSSLPNPYTMLEYATREEAEAAARAGEEVIPLRRYGGDESFVITKREPIVTADHVRRAAALKSGEGVGWYEVDCLLDADGSTLLERWTRFHIGNYLVVVYDGQAIDANYVKSPVWLNVVVTGAFDRRRAEDAAVVIRGGNLPAPVVVLEEAKPTR